jgi:hypothetical protein
LPLPHVGQRVGQGQNTKMLKRKHFVSEEMTLPAPISGNLLITNRASPFRGSNDGPDDQCVGQEARCCTPVLVHDKRTVRDQAGRLSALLGHRVRQ